LTLPKSSTTTQKRLLPGVCELFKERNTYGILTGLTKTEAKQKFPEEYAKRERDEWVLGSERFEELGK